MSFRAKDISFVADWWGLKDIYCPSVIKKRQKKINISQNCSNSKLGKRKCQERQCIQKRKKTKMIVLCTAKEVRLWQLFGKWPWNHRNCSKLSSRSETRKCRKEKKLRRCVEKRMRSKKYKSKKHAWLSCIYK